MHVWRWATYGWQVQPMKYIESNACDQQFFFYLYQNIRISNFVPFIYFMHFTVSCITFYTILLLIRPNFLKTKVILSCSIWISVTSLFLTHKKMFLIFLIAKYPTRAADIFFFFVTKKTVHVSLIHECTPHTFSSPLTDNDLRCCQFIHTHTHTYIYISFFWRYV